MRPCPFGNIWACLWLCAAMIAASGGCTPAWYRKEADQVAYSNIERAQQEALDRTEPFTIARPDEELRRRLLIDQQLPHTGPASLGTDELTLISQWPDGGYFERDDEPDDEGPPLPEVIPNETLHISLIDALQVAARSSREYQSQKEQVFLAALALDLERNEFRFIWAGVAEALYIADLRAQEVVIDDQGNTRLEDVRGFEKTGTLSVSRRFHNAMTVTGLIGLDLVKLLTLDRSSSRGLFFDGTVALPLLRGSSKIVVTEPLTQAERDVIYAIYGFERFKRVFAVSVAREYLGVLQQLDQLHNAEQNYRRLIASTRRVQRLAEAGWIPEIQVDQARQDELRANNRWVLARESYARRLDSFKFLLGLPPDANVKLDDAELDKLRERADHVVVPVDSPDVEAELEQELDELEMEALPADAEIELVPPSRVGGGQYELEEDYALALAIEHRLDLRTALGRVDDAQRKVVVAADGLQADLVLLGSASLGERRRLATAHLDDARMRFSEGRYTLGAGLDLPLERTQERNIYRASLIDLERAVRDTQELEDRLKIEVREALRALLETRETARIQAEAVRVAERRVISTDLFLQAGRAQVRDVLEAQEALISAQNALTAALVEYRIAELELQRDIGLLEVATDGLWQEFTPEAIAGDQ